jgi:hypothetical protein
LLVRGSSILATELALMTSWDEPGRNGIIKPALSLWPVRRASPAAGAIVILTAIIVTSATCKRFAGRLTWRCVVVVAFISTTVVTATFITSATITIFTVRWARCVAVDTTAIFLAITIACSIATAAVVIAVVVAVPVARASSAVSTKVFATAVASSTAFIVTVAKATTAETSLWRSVSNTTAT